MCYGQRTCTMTILLWPECTIAIMHVLTSMHTLFTHAIRLRRIMACALQEYKNSNYDAEADDICFNDASA